jgi:hypothetical protein
MIAPIVPSPKPRSRTELKLFPSPIAPRIKISAQRDLFQEAPNHLQSSSWFIAADFMTRLIHDKFAKDYFESLLEPFGLNSDQLPVISYQLPVNCD